MFVYLVLRKSTTTPRIARQIHLQKGGGGYGTRPQGTCIYRVQSMQCLVPSELLTPNPLSTQRVCPPAAPKGGGGTGQGLVDIRERLVHLVVFH